ncbi:putative L protein [Cytorhabdovirus fragariarugosus]|uniref:Replicase n=1 Tax=Cytorhabdovirus fragariarugosus TaxID=1985706 RepID=A0A2U8J9E5_9RHAB|nr:putative L protein [Cytorhabdovirus fragariarugosus]AWK49433.1 putative L protein [Cytorhabdovirus fragariarugosus]
MDFAEKANDTEDTSVRNKDPLPDFHLRNPVRPLDWLNNNMRATSRNRIDQAYINKIGNQRVRVGIHTDLYLTEHLDFSHISVEGYKESVIDMITRAKIDTEILGQNRDIDLQDILIEMGRVDIKFWKGMRFFGHVLSVMNSLSSRRQIPKEFAEEGGVVKIQLKEMTVTVLLTGILVSGNTGTHLLYDGDWVRLAADVYTQRFLFCIGAAIGRSINPMQYPDLRTIEAVMRWGDKVLRALGNEGFKVLKTYEAIVIGVIQEKGERGIISPGLFLSNTIQDLFDDRMIYKEYAEQLIEIIRAVDNLHYLTQLYGMHRIWGHPMVDSKKGMEKVISIGRKNIIRNSSLSQDAGRMFKMLFSREYRSKHGMYPAVHEYPSELVTKLLENDGSATNVKVHRIEEWDRVVFKQMFQLPETFNLSMVVADKSISPTRSELATIIKTRRTVMSPEKRRGVIRWLEDTTLNPREFLKTVNEGNFPDDHKIIGLTPKERELNPTPRMFALMSHLLRVYVVLTEQLLSDHILKYFPQITMTDTLLDLTKKMYSTVRHQSVLNKKRGSDRTWASKVICMSLDFEKWNGHMRKEMTLGVFTPIGDLFGMTELYNVTYDIFSECYYYLADGTYVPDIHKGDLLVSEPFSFQNHQGGMEGLRQKGWTIFTVCALEVVLSQYDCTYRIMGMGDNQVLQITLYTGKLNDDGSASDEGLSEMKETMRRIFEALVNTFTSAGLPLKPLETWMSEDLYVYGKIPLWKGVPLSMDLKKIMRMFPFSNAEVMTLENALSTISGNALASTQATSCIWTPYLVAILMNSLCIRDFLEYHPLIGQGLMHVTGHCKEWRLRLPNGERHNFLINTDTVPSRRKLTLVMQMIPRTLMGYNGINILEMMMRGFPDNLSRDVSYLRSVEDCTSCPDWLKKIIHAWLQPIYMPHINYATLIQDVTAANLLSPRSPSSGIKQVVTQYLGTGTKIRNQEFKGLMEVKNKNHEEFFSELLCEGEELHIRLLHDIFEASIYGYVDSILSKVVKTTTIQRLAMKSSSRDIFDVITDDEMGYFNYFKWRCTVSGEETGIRCPTEICRNIRASGWQKTLRGVTIPHPHSFMREQTCNEVKGCNCQDGYMSVHLPDGQLPNSVWMTSIGGNPPYLGSMTKEKVVVGAGGKVYSSEPLIKRPINLLRIINWFVPEESIVSNVIKSLVSAITDMDPTPYVGVREGSAGAELHRYKDSSTSHGALTSSSYLLSTRYHISSDHFHRYCRGSDNTDLHFQALYCYIVEMTNLELHKCFRSGAVIPRFKHYHQHCNECIKTVKEDFIDLTRERIIETIPSKKSNPYLFVSSNTIRVLEDRSPISRLNAEEYTSSDYDTASEKLKRNWLQDILIDKITSDIMRMSNDETSLSSNLLDNGSFERTMYLKLDPKYIIDGVMGNLSMLAEWNWLESTGHHKKMSIGEIARSIITILTGADSSGFIGIGMFYCWEITANRLVQTYPEITVPNSNPISVETACRAIKESLMSLALKKTWAPKDRFPVISEDEKSSMFVIRKLLYRDMTKINNCLGCKYIISRLSNVDMKRLRSIRCSSNHSPLNRLSSMPWRYSHVTIERLRKDCESGDIATINHLHEINRLPEGLRFVRSIMNNTDLMMRPTEVETLRDDNLSKFPDDHYYFSDWHLHAIDTIPTKTRSKYVTILDPHRKAIRGMKTFCIGDGLGNTSDILVSMGVSAVISSTILDPSKAIPQTYVHNVYPGVLGSGNKGLIDTVQSIDKTNNILDDNWIMSWKDTTETCDLLVSDIEIIGSDTEILRENAVMNMLKLKSWKFCIIKDYIYSCHYLSNMIKLIGSSRPKSWSLVTTELRSSHYPEVWWIIKESKMIEQGPLQLGMRPDRLSRIWNRFMEIMIGGEGLHCINREEIMILRSMTPHDIQRRVLSGVRAWLSLPLIGLVFPDKGRMTRVYYYLRKSKMPAYAKFQRDNSKLKLYDKDYYRLRDILLCLALSMCEDISMLSKEMSMTEYWFLDWEEKETGIWDCVLRKSLTPEGMRASIDDYLPYIRSIMFQRRMTFREIGHEVRFKHMSKDEHEERKIVVFPISRIAHMTSKHLYKDKRRSQ